MKHIRRLVLALLLSAGLVSSHPAPARAAIGARMVATGLEFPAAFTFAPDGRVFYGERFTGRIRLRNLATSGDSLFFTVPNLATTGEQGLLGLAVHPRYPSTPHVFAFATRTVDGVTRYQIVRLTNSGGTGTSMTVILETPATIHHNGGRILFGPDRKLYVVTGDGGNQATSQDLNSVQGKVLRLDPTGAVPTDNPFPGSYVFAYGFRNSFGLTFDPQSGRLWETENGPQCNDELNLALRGRNHGWGPTAACTTPPGPPTNTNRDGPRPVLPKRLYNPVIAPTGAAFCSACGLGSTSSGRMFLAAWKTGELRRVSLDSTRTAVASQSVVYRHGSGILSVERAPDGKLYFSDSTAIFRLVVS